MPIQASVIIPTLNRCDLLGKTLESIVHQKCDFNLFEVIVVDNGSVDHTKQVVDSFGTKLPKLRYLYDDTPGLHTGRNLGMQAAQGDILIYLDDDVYLFETHIDAVLNTFRNEEIGLVGGNNLPDFEIEPPQWVQQMWVYNGYGKYLHQLSLLDFGDEFGAGGQYIPYNFVFGCNFSIRKQLLIKMNGFSPDCFSKDFVLFTGAGETEAARRVTEDFKLKVYFNPLASVYHFMPKERLTYNYLKSRGKYAGVCESYQTIRTRRSAKITKRMLTLLYGACRWILKGNKAMLAYQLGYLKGYYMHYLRCKRDKDLLEWVLREHYLGENGVLPIYGKGICDEVGNE